MIHGYAISSILVFFGVVFAALLIDLFMHKKDKAVSLANAATWSFIWVAVSLAFAAYVGRTQGMDKASLFISGYLLEKSLSVDNLFVFMAIFASFSIKDEFQHRILYFGILGALVLRFIFIAAGTSLLLLGQWVLGIFGLFVLWSAWQMYRSSGGDDNEIEDYTNHWSVRIAGKFLRVYPRCDGHKLFTKQNAQLCVTPLMLCLIAVEVADIMFAFDSVPAVIAITQDPFLVYTSNIFAILGLRSMYFLLAAAKRYLCHLEKAVIVILAFIGIKMLLGVFDVYHISALASLSVVLVSLTAGVMASVVFPEQVEPSVE
jgi:tellurite resistance protein TerC